MYLEAISSNKHPHNGTGTTAGGGAKLVHTCVSVRTTRRLSIVHKTNYLSEGFAGN